MERGRSAAGLVLFLLALVLAAIGLVVRALTWLLIIAVALFVACLIRGAARRNTAA